MRSAVAEPVVFAVSMFGTRLGVFAACGEVCVFFVGEPGPGGASGGESFDCVDDDQRAVDALESFGEVGVDLAALRVVVAECVDGAVEDDPFPGVGVRESWQFSVCQGGGVDGRRCVNDDTIDDDGGCGLLLLSYEDMTTQEWIGGVESGGSALVVCRCTTKTTPDQVVS